MTDEELFELEEILEHPEVIDDLCEDDFHRLAEVYHRNCVNRLTAKIMSEVNETDKMDEELASHPDYPEYRFHFDEAIRHFLARSPEIREEEQDRLIFSFGMSDRLQQVLKSAAKAMSGQLLKPEEKIHGTFD